MTSPVVKEQELDTQPTDRVEAIALFFISSLCYFAYGMVPWVVASNAHLYDNIVIGWLHGFLAPITLFFMPILSEPDMTVYAFSVSGSWYDLGFVSGLIMLGWVICWTKNIVIRESRNL